MQRYAIKLSYKGSAYHGWQTQPNDVSVQETIEKALSTLLHQPVYIVGAGRTDAGVHAKMMVAHFDFDNDDLDCETLAAHLNSFLPPDIAIFEIFKTEANFHARFSAKSRTYKYYVSTAKDAFQNEYELRIRFNLDFDKMNKAAEKLFDFIDFTTFSKTHTDVKTNNCKIMHARWEQTAPDKYCFTIKADRFLRNMVRAIVGTLFEVGKGKMSVEQFAEIIEKKDRRLAGSSAAAKGLFLTDIEY